MLRIELHMKLALNLFWLYTWQADPPDPSKIREEDIIGVTVLLLTCSYLGQEFIRVGYYVNNDYDDEQLREEPPQKVLIDRVQRNILADKPRVTKFPINFHPENNEHGEQPPPSPEINENGEQPPPSHHDPSDWHAIYLIPEKLKLSVRNLPFLILNYNTVIICLIEISLPRISVWPNIATVKCWFNCVVLYHVKSFGRRNFGLVTICLLSWNLIGR